MKKTEEFRKKYGPWAFVAGGSKGLGGAWCDALAQRGLNIVTTARGEQDLQLKIQELKSHYGIEAIGVVMDLAAEDLLDRVKNATDHLEIGFLVYNAGLADLKLFTKQPLETELFRLNLNCRGPLILSHYFGKKMVERERGGIVLMSSMGGLIGNPYNVGYAASKSYNRILAEGLWYEYGLKNVDVLACVAGLTKTHEDISDENNSPGSKPMLPEVVVDEALGALGKKPSMVPGAGNRFFAYLLSHLIPTKKGIKMMGNLYEKNWPDMLKED